MCFIDLLYTFIQYTYMCTRRVTKRNFMENTWVIFLKELIYTFYFLPSKGTLLYKSWRFEFVVGRGCPHFNCYICTLFLDCIQAFVHNKQTKKKTKSFEFVLVLENTAVCIELLTILYTVQKKIHVLLYREQEVKVSICI